MSDKDQTTDSNHVNRVLCPQLNLHPPDSPLDLYYTPLNHFLSIPWTAALLPPNHPTAIAFIPQCRNPLSPQHDQLFGRTLSSPRALRHMLCLFVPSDPQHVHDSTRPIAKVSTLCDLDHGLSGYPAVLHGGVTMAIVDEAMGLLMELNRALGKEGAVFKASTVTASLEIGFLRPVPLPSVVCVTSSLEETSGRKAKIRCEVKDKQDTLLARCSSTFVALKSNI